MIETKVDVTQLNGGYAQGGMLVRTDDDNYIKFDVISDDGQHEVQPDRAALARSAGRSRTRSRSSRRLPANVGDVWLRLTKTGHDLQGRVLARRHDLDGDRRRRSRTR